jgi:hypothetical protein
LSEVSFHTFTQPRNILPAPPADFMPGGVRQHPRAHADEPVDLPAMDVETRTAQDTLPRQRVTVDRLDERAVEIEDDRAP